MILLLKSHLKSLYSISEEYVRFLRSLEPVADAVQESVEVGGGQEKCAW